MWKKRKVGDNSINGFPLLWVGPTQGIKNENEANKGFTHKTIRFDMIHTIKDGLNSLDKNCLMHLFSSRKRKFIYLEKSILIREFTDKFPNGNFSVSFPRNEGNWLDKLPDVGGQFISSVNSRIKIDFSINPRSNLP